MCITYTSIIGSYIYLYMIHINKYVYIYISLLFERWLKADVITWEGLSSSF